MHSSHHLFVCPLFVLADETEQYSVHVDEWAHNWLHGLRHFTGVFSLSSAAVKLFNISVKKRKQYICSFLILSLHSYTPPPEELIYSVTLKVLNTVKMLLPSTELHGIFQQVHLQQVTKLKQGSQLNTGILFCHFGNKTDVEQFTQTHFD